MTLYLRYLLNAGAGPHTSSPCCCMNSRSLLAPDCLVVLFCIACITHCQLYCDISHNCIFCLFFLLIVFAPFTALLTFFQPFPSRFPPATPTSSAAIPRPRTCLMEAIAWPCQRQAPMQPFAPGLCSAPGTLALPPLEDTPPPSPGPRTQQQQLLPHLALNYGRTIYMPAMSFCLHYRSTRMHDDHHHADNSTASCSTYDLSASMP